MHSTAAAGAPLGGMAGVAGRFAFGSRGPPPHIYGLDQSGEHCMFSKRRAGALGLALAMLGALSLAATTADARVGGGSSVGSRGSRTFSSPPATNTAPRAAPIEKSITQPGKAPLAAPSTAGSRTWFGGWRGILLGGLFAGIFASVFGFGALASVLGFLLQAALIVGAVWLVMNWFRSRQLQPATASESAARSRAASDVN